MDMGPEWKPDTRTDPKQEAEDAAEAMIVPDYEKAARRYFQDQDGEFPEEDAATDIEALKDEVYAIRREVSEIHSLVLDMFCRGPRLSFLDKCALKWNATCGKVKDTASRLLNLWYIVSESLFWGREDPVNPDVSGSYKNTSYGPRF